MSSADAKACGAERDYMGPTDPIRAARHVLITCTKEAGHQSRHYDASCDVSWPNEIRCRWCGNRRDDPINCGEPFHDGADAS